MHPNLKHLIELQGVDSRLLDVRARLAAFPKRAAEIEARVAAAREALAQAKAALTQTLKDRKKYELDVDDWKGKVAKYKDQLYAVKTNEAYKALQHEIQMAEQHISSAEDRLLEQMVAGEEYERKVKSAEKSAAEVEAAAQQDRQKVAAEQAAAESERAALESERQQALAAIPEDLLDLYRRLAARHQGVALAEVREETCTVCRVKVRPHVYQELRNPASQEIFHCESCTRILYSAGHPAAHTPEQALAQTSEQ